jgi:peptidoglycan hydrolase-like protein with peptidoglycan-binding domain
MKQKISRKKFLGMLGAGLIGLTFMPKDVMANFFYRNQNGESKRLLTIDDINIKAEAELYEEDDVYYDLANKTVTFNSYNITADVSGSATVTLKKCSYANFPTTLTTLDTVTLTTAIKNSGDFASPITINSGEYLFFELTSATTVERVKVVLL